MAYLIIDSHTVRPPTGGRRTNTPAGWSISMGKTLWRIEAEGDDPSGGAAWVYYAITDDSANLPDVNAAYHAMRGRQGNIYHIGCVRQVDAPTPFDDRPNVLDDGIHDQTTGRVIPFDDWPVG